MVWKSPMRFGISWLFAILFVAGIVSWQVARIGTRNAEVVIEKYSFSDNGDGSTCSLEFHFRFSSPEERIDQVVHAGYSDVPKEMVLATVESGQTIKFSYREHEHWGRKRENPNGLVVQQILSRPVAPGSLEIWREIIEKWSRVED